MVRCAWLRSRRRFSSCFSTDFSSATLVAPNSSTVQPFCLAVYCAAPPTFLLISAFSSLKNVATVSVSCRRSTYSWLLPAASAASYTFKTSGHEGLSSSAGNWANFPMVLRARLSSSAKRVRALASSSG